MYVLILAMQSLRSRWLTSLLTALAVAFSVALLLGVATIADGARKSFQSTVTGTHLIVGARSGPVQLLLHAVFRIGSPTSPISYESYMRFAAHPEVAWAIPLSLGDSHRGFPVVGTNESYFEQFRFGRERKLAFVAGEVFGDDRDAVLGSQVARSLGYSIGDEITLVHGMEVAAFLRHEDRPFRVSGILAPTGTPVDRSVHVTLGGVDSLHVGWEDGAPPAPGANHADQDEPRRITAFLLGLRSTVGIFAVQREIGDYAPEPLTAVLPGATLVEIWKMVAVANTALETVAIFVVIAGLMGMLSMILASLEQRRREIAILRAVGARPRHVFTLLVAESGLLTVGGCVIGFAVLYAALAAAGPLLERHFGLLLAAGAPSPRDLGVVAAVVSCGMLVGLIPGWRAYRRSLVDGLGTHI